MASVREYRLFTGPSKLPTAAINLGAVRTPLVERLEQGLRQAPTKCSQCIKGCAPAKIPFCITHALIEAVKGNREEGLFFSGSNVERLERMVHVRDIMDELMNEWRVST